MITGKTGLVGIMGDPVEHSLSPPMHNAAFHQLKLDYVYVPFHVKRGNLASAIEGARTMGIKGLNLTIPHKIEVINYLDELDEAAELIGAVNTVKFTENKAVGYNTDGFGAVKAIEETTSVQDKKIIIIGAGGAARAISFQLLLSRVGEVLIANRTREKACNLRDDLKERFNTSLGCLGLDDELGIELEDTDVLINTTPVGMHPHQDDKPVVTSDMMHSDLVVNDIVYNPLETGLLREAGKVGATTVHGTKMLIYQGIGAFRIWTGINPPVEVFETALMRELGY
ncbi:shikimate dehydrogenase [Methanobacterium formicicum]|uniref:Shikimate dehydrogenase (NADP(+)) n=1 Tax=Methanobacterium formicicum (strain DSM 3637 / PP1) TaxID=1204725 RepID=K2QC11_METFP|nr:shikimate dehydrogenase [Methanobacterium formicicum]EKF85511.1 shikimate dehydrogenase [Methanobacterium formicicum DSM 3637]